MKGKMAIIGDGDSVLAFTAGGVEAFTADSTEAAKELLKKLAKDYKIIFITDVIAKEIDEQIRKYVSSPYPIRISLPSKTAATATEWKVLNYQWIRLSGSIYFSTTKTRKVNRKCREK